MRKYVYLALCLLIFHGLQAQPPLYYLEKLGTEDGLSSNLIADIVQDGDGYLWIATHNGLNRYDGTEVVRFFADPLNAGSLPDNYIFRMIRMDSSRLAIGTFHGLSIANTRRNSFHNYLFSVPLPAPLDARNRQAEFTNDERKLWEAYNNSVEYLETDPSGNLWVGTPVSLFCFDRQMKLRYSYYRPCLPEDLYGKRLRFVQKIIPLGSSSGMRDPGGRRAPGMAGDVLLLLDTGWCIWQHRSGKITGIQSYRSGQLSFLSKSSYSNQCFQLYGHYLIYTTDVGDRLYVFDEISGSRASCKFYGNNPQYSSIYRYNPAQRCISALGNGWIGVSYQTRGMVLMHLQADRNKLSVNFYPNAYFPEYTFREIVADREGNWWVATDEDGVMKIAPGKQNFELFDLKDPGEPLHPMHEMVFLDKIRKKIYAASYGDGLYELDPDTKKINHLWVKLQRKGKVIPGNPEINFLWNIRPDRGDTLWIGTQAGLIWYHTKKKIFGRLSRLHPAVLDSVAITTQFRDREGLVWMGLGRGNGLCIYDTKTRLFQLVPNKQGGYPFRYPLAVVEDHRGDLWFLSDDVASLVRWERRTGKFFVITPDLLRGKAKRFIGGLYLDPQDAIWYAVEGIGLLRYDTRSARAEVYDQKDGLITSSVKAILGDESGRIWLATAEGLTSFDPYKKQFINYGMKEGLQVNYLSSQFFYDTLSHAMYGGGPGRILRFQTGITRPRPHSLPVRITAVFVNNKPVAAGDGDLYVPYHNNDLSVHFTGINLTDGKDNQYAYRLSRRQDQREVWVNIGRQRQIRLADLAPGAYDFTVRAAREGGGWSGDAAHLRFIIATPFSRSPRFYGMLVLLAFGILYGWYRYRLSQMLKLQTMRNQISHDLHDEIGSHLTNISLLSLMATKKLKDSEQANNLLQRIYEDSRQISESLREIVWSVNPKNDSVKSTLSYLVRYASGMLEAKNIAVEAPVEELEIPRLNMSQRRDLMLIFKEVIHNIVKHAGASKVIIALQEDGRKLSLQITDNGRGFDPSAPGDGNGLQSIRERAARHRWKLETGSAPGGGARVVLYLRST